MLHGNQVFSGLFSSVPSYRGSSLWNLIESTTAKGFAGLARIRGLIIIRWGKSMRGFSLHLFWVQSGPRIYCASHRVSTTRTSLSSDLSLVSFETFEHVKEGSLSVANETFVPSNKIGASGRVTTEREKVLSKDFIITFLESLPSLPRNVCFTLPRFTLLFSANVRYMKLFATNTLNFITHGILHRRIFPTYGTIIAHILWFGRSVRSKVVHVAMSFGML